MWLQRLELSAVRNIGDLSVELDPGFNFFFGLNGAGKTALLEAVHLLGRGRSFRTLQFEDLIQRDARQMVIRAVLADEHVGSQRVAFARSRGGETEVRVNEQSVRRMSQMAALLPLEVITPTSVDLVFGGPGVRRQWLDWGVFHVKPDHLLLLRSYSVALRQRNAVLKAMANGRATRTELDPWTEELSRLGQLVASARREHLAAIESAIRYTLAALSDDFEIELLYRQGWPDDQQLANVLGESAEREVRSGATIAGAHRADVEFRTALQPCATVLSRGQAKLLACALMLAQSDSIQAVSKRQGLFLIDDVGAELDEAHRERLFDALAVRGCQVLATSVDQPAAITLARCQSRAVFHVERGQISRWVSAPVT